MKEIFNAKILKEVSLIERKRGAKMKKICLVVVVIALLSLTGCGKKRSFTCKIFDSKDNYSETAAVSYNEKNEVTKIVVTAEFPYDYVSDDDWKILTASKPTIKGVKYTFGNKGQKSRNMVIEIDFTKVDLEEMNLNNFPYNYILETDKGYSLSMNIEDFKESFIAYYKAWDYDVVTCDGK